MNRDLNQLSKYVQNIQIGESSGHDWLHTKRVYNNCQLIISELDCDINKQLVFVSALLHDIADHKFGYNDIDRENMIKDIFNELALEDDILKDVIYIVNNISFSKNTVLNNIEGQIVQDADRLDALGYIGIARTFSYGGNKNRSMQESIDHFYDKLFNLTDLMNTQIAKNIAIEKTIIMKDFIDGLKKEIN